MTWIGAAFTLSFHVPCVFIYNDSSCILPFMTGPLFLYKDEPCFCKHKLNIKIESEVTLLNLSGFFMRLALLLFVLSCGSWESSSGGTLTHLGAFHHPSGVTTLIEFNHISFLQLFIFFFHVHFIPKSLNISLVVPYCSNW